MSTNAYSCDLVKCKIMKQWLTWAELRPARIHI